MDNQPLGRRSGPRSPILFPISFRTSHDSFERPARVRDMSAHGIAFFSEHQLEPAARIEVVLMVPYEITLTEMMLVRMNAEVLRIDDSSHSRSVAVALCPLAEAETGLAAPSAAQA